MARDNFNISTVRILAERVGYLCSNPGCRIHTIGPNKQTDKSTKIGKAAHITAASINGPRFDKTLTPAQRSHIENGIWLCSNCSDLIDKDEDRFPTLLLNKWKIDAEDEMLLKLKGLDKKDENFSPFLEVDLKYYSSGRWNHGYSDKNPISEDETGRKVRVIGRLPIIYWKLSWEYSLAIYNNSSNPAFNVKLIQTSENKFSTLNDLPKINNIKPYDHLELEALYQTNYIEDHYLNVDKILEKRIPDLLNGLTLEILYLDNARKEHRTIVEIKDQDVINTKSVS